MGWGEVIRVKKTLIGVIRLTMLLPLLLPLLPLLLLLPLPKPLPHTHTHTHTNVCHIQRTHMRAHLSTHDIRSELFIQYHTLTYTSTHTNKHINTLTHTHTHTPTHALTCTNAQQGNILWYFSPHVIWRRKRITTLCSNESKTFLKTRLHTYMLDSKRLQATRRPFLFGTMYHVEGWEPSGQRSGHASENFHFSFETNNV